MHVTKHRALALFAVLALAACSGKDGTLGPKGDVGANGANGADGANGTNGVNGTDGKDGKDGAPGAAALTSDVESCVACHGKDRDFDFAAKHALARIDVSAQAATISGSDAVVTFTVKVGGVASDAFTPTIAAPTSATPAGGVLTWTASAPYYTYEYSATTGQGTRTSVTATSTTSAADALAKLQKFESLGSGKYKVTIYGKAPAVGIARTYMVRVVAKPGSTDLQEQATVVAHIADASGKLTYDAPTDQSCMNCHGDHVFAPGAHGHSSNPISVSACVVCHVTSSQSRGTPGDRLKAYVHGIHNSKHMPARTIGTYNKPAGTYARNDSTSASSQFSIGFPGYMNNCSTCHDTAENLAKVNAAPVSWSNCMSCHDSFDSFPKTTAGGSADFHQAYTATTDCSVCHKAATMPTAYKAEQFHNGLMTERAGLIWAGQDQSVEQGKKITVEITEIKPVTGGKLSIKWKAYDATNGNAAYNPCNTTVASGPVFMDAVADATTGQVASNFDVLRAYAQGNDWVNAGQGSSPGQPGSALALSAKATGNTTCASNVATSIIPAQTTTATKGLVALQGKPQIKYGPANKVIQVRAKSAVREFVIATGDAPTAANARRVIVDIAKCQKCHLGSVYQHGGNRVDNTFLCVMCHNPAANEKNNRVTLGVDATEAYDGKTGETYDLRYMIHAIHSAGETEAPFVIYRTRGIYAWGSKAALDALPNWPTTKASCNLAVPTAEASTSEAYKVYGSVNFGTKPTAGANGVCLSPLPASTDGAWLPHTKIVVHYPRPLNDCAACHVDGSEKSLPDPTRSVPVTLDAGAAPWNALLDDTLMGPVAATCMSCHQYGTKGEQAAVRSHAYQNGWVPQVFPNGIQTLLDAASK